MAKIVKVSMKQWNTHMQQLGSRFMPAAQRGIVSGAARCIPFLQKRTMMAPPASDRGTKGAVDTGLYKAGWRTAPVANGAKVFNVRPQSGVIDYGRRPAPVGRDGIRNLEAWVRRKLKLTGGEARTAAWAIAKTLAKRPLKARKVLSGGEKEMVKIVEGEIERELDVELGRR